MTGWGLAHLVALGIWAGIVLAEGAVEAVGVRDPKSARAAAEIHYLIDLFFEGPILVAVLVTGAVLSLRVPLTTLHFVKIGFGLFAIGVNVWCLGVVVRRHRRFQDGGGRRETRRVLLAGKLGVPAALAALYLGLRLTGLV